MRLVIDNHIKKRILRIIWTDMAVIAVGIFYYCFIYYTNISIPCIFNRITGLRCPFCGITHLAISALNLDFNHAFQYNPLVFIMSPIIIIYYHIMYIKNGEIRVLSRKKQIHVLGLLVIYAILRNIYAF